MLRPRGRVCPSQARKEATEHVAIGVEKKCWWVEEAGCVPLSMRPSASRDLLFHPSEIPMELRSARSAVAFCKEFVLRAVFCFSAHACCEGDFALYFQ